MRDSKAALWYPFRSAEVQEIAEHLTPEEYSRLVEHSGRWGVLFGMVGFFAVYVVLRWLDPFLHPQFGMAWTLAILVAIAIPMGLAIGWVISVPWRRKARRILCETAYARQRGFTPDTLRLYSTRFHLRTLLVWVVPWAALVAWIAAWDGPYVSQDARDKGFNQIIKLNLIVVMTFLYMGIHAFVRSRAKSNRQESTIDV